jgi:hypothetical protein
MFDTKIAIVLRDDLAPWQELNVTAFLMRHRSLSAKHTGMQLAMSIIR